ncbi:hypothetical protein CC86DRAFT_456469 [Ophiobolus disseminans]|uniref:Ankyrin n=1 Tax=Ophiobolus disseminans TaxID=1469910 RepID=A0A6A6ZWJ4_9PLEO|nr:hypothetical protein CC86DRAFT_456469 [Ophiobolus disseminans]
MDSPRYASPTISSRTFSFRQSKIPSSVTSDGLADERSLHVESPRARHVDQLQALAAAVGVPFSLPNPMLSAPNQRAVPQYASDKAGAEAFLLSLRPKRFLIGKSSKNYASEEVLRALDKAIELKLPLPILEALLQFVESSTLQAPQNTAFIADKKGHHVPTLEYIFSQVSGAATMRLFLPRVSQRSRDNALARILSDHSPSVDTVTALLEWGANPETCRDFILRLSANAGSDDVLRVLLLSPALNSTELLSQALIQAAESGSLQIWSMLLLRGADANFNEGEALRHATSKQRYAHALAATLLSRRAVSSGILDTAVSAVEQWSPEIKQPYLTMFLYAGAAGRRTSKAVTSLISMRDHEILANSITFMAFTHGSFPNETLFQAAIEMGDMTLALDTLRLSKHRSFTSYAKTGVHLQLIDACRIRPNESLEVITEFLTLGVSGDTTSEMLARCCEPELVGKPEIITVIEHLVRIGMADASYANGRSIMLAIDAANTAVLTRLLTARPTRKVLNKALEHSDRVLEDRKPEKLQIWAALIHAGARGDEVDRLLVKAVESPSMAAEKIRALLPAASLDYGGGEAIVRAITLQKLDIIEAFLAKRRPEASLPTIWKQTRQLFALDGEPRYGLSFMLSVMTMLYNAGRGAAPLDDLLHDATQCASKETAWTLTSQFLQWGASPDLPLGAALTACIKRCDRRTLVVLLSRKPKKTSIRYAFEEVLLHRGSDRYETLKIIIDAGPDASCLDTALPQVLKENAYDTALVHLLVNNNARIHSSLADYLVPVVLNGDLQTLDIMLPGRDSGNIIFPSLKAFLSSRSDWQNPDGPSLPLLKVLLSKTGKGAWADQIFSNYVKLLNQHAANLFINHLTSSNVFSDTLVVLLSHDKLKLTRGKLSVTLYLLERGARGDIVDEIFLEAAGALNREWISALGPYLIHPTTKQKAFELVVMKNPCTNNRNGAVLDIQRWLLDQNVRGQAVDAAFVAAGQALILEEFTRLLPYVSDNTVFSVVLDHLAQDIKLVSTDEGLTVLKLLIQKGASLESVFGAIRAAAQSLSTAGVRLILEISNQDGLTKAAFKGLLDSGDNLASSTSRSILRVLIKFGLDIDDAKTAVSLAVATHDVDLMADIAPADSTGGICGFALTCLASQGQRWLTTTGLTFLRFVLEKGAESTVILQMVEFASKSRNLSALMLLVDASHDKQVAANTAFAQLALGDETEPASEDLSVLEFVLGHGANGAAVENAAADAARTSNYEVLDVFLKSPVAASVIPSAFRAVARAKSKRLSSEQLSIASILVRHGVATEILAIAAAEATKQLDLEALIVLSQSPRFPGVTDDTVRILLLSEDLWRSPEGLRIMRYLFEIGVSSDTKKGAAVRAVTILDSDMLRTILDADSSFEVVEAAFSALTDLQQKWMSPEGVRIAQLLLQKGPSQPVLDKAFIQSCQYFYYDAVQLFLPRISDASVFSEAMGKATSSGLEWVSELHIIEELLRAGVENDVVENAFLKAAAALNLDAVRLLASDSLRADVHSKALGAVLTNESWRQSIKLLEFLLEHGANGEPVHRAYVSAAGSLDVHAVQLLANHVQNTDIKGDALSAVISNSSWLLPEYLDLVTLIYQQGVTPKAHGEALALAAASLNVPCVTLLAKRANSKMASRAFARAIGSNTNLDTEEGTTVLKRLAGRGAKGPAVDSALIDSARKLRLDLVTILKANIDANDLNTFASAFDSVLSTGGEWLARPEGLQILQVLIETGAVGESAPDALVVAAREGNFAAVDLLAQLVDDSDIYTQAFGEFIQSSSLWLEDESLELLELLLRRGASGESLDEALLAAVDAVASDAASTDLITLLLQFEADINFQHGAALQTAAQHGRGDLIEMLLSRTPSEISLYMALQTSLQQEHEEDVVLELFQAITGFDSGVQPEVNHTSELGDPLIFYTLLYYGYSVEIVKQICELGADLDATVGWSVYDADTEPIPKPDEDQVTPLLLALLNDASDEVIEEVLIPYGADHNYVPSESQASAVILAAKLDRRHILTKLIDLKAELAQTDCYDRTPLFYAGRNGNTSAITSLLRKKPPVNDGSLHEAARELHPRAVKLLATKGHDVDFPSLKHNGRNALCELAFRCHASQDSVRLHDTLCALREAKSNPLRKYRGKTPLFYAMDNPDPVPMVSKIIEVCLWQDLNDASNVFEKDDHSYSATMYIKKGLYEQSERHAYDILQVLEDASAQDRYYAKERMRQPFDAVGMPQHIANLDRKKWIRSSRLEEDEEDHRRRLRRDAEEMAHRDQLNSSRHLLTMEQREDLALQETLHKSDNHWQGLQFRSMSHAQTMRYKDEQIDYRLDDEAVSHRLKGGIDDQARNAQLRHEFQTKAQRLTFQEQEQDLGFVGAQVKQQLRLEGVSSENALKTDQAMRDLQLRAVRSTMDQADMDLKLRHVVDINADKVFTQDRMEDIARDSQQRKLTLDQTGRQAQLEYQGASDNRKLMTEGQLNQYRQDNNNESIRTRNALIEVDREAMYMKNEMMQADRNNKMAFTRESDHQKLNTLRNQGYIANRTFDDHGAIERSHLAQRGEVERTNLRESGQIANENLYNRGQISNQTLEERTGIERSNLMQRSQIEVETLQQKGRTENQTLSNKHSLLQADRENAVRHTQQTGQARVYTQQQMNDLNAQKNANNVQAQHQKNADNLRFQGQKNSKNLNFQEKSNQLNAQKNRNNLNFQGQASKISAQKNANNLNFQGQSSRINAQKNANNVQSQAQQAGWKQAGRQ